MSRLAGILFLLSIVGALAEDIPCNYLDKMGENNELYSMHEILVETGVLPPNTGEVATLLLPNGMAFVDFLINEVKTDLESFSDLLDRDPVTKAKVDSILMSHVLPCPNLSLDTLKAASPFQTALSLLNDDDPTFYLSVSEDLGTVKAGQNEALILNPIDLCGTTAYIIDKVLLPLHIDDATLPQTTHAMINTLFANLTSDCTFF